MFHANVGPLKEPCVHRACVHRACVTDLINAPAIVSHYTLQLPVYSGTLAWEISNIAMETDNDNWCKTDLLSPVESSSLQVKVTTTITCLTHVVSHL